MYFINLRDQRFFLFPPLLKFRELRLGFGQLNFKRRSTLRVIATNGLLATQDRYNRSAPREP